MSFWSGETLVKRLPQIINPGGQFSVGNIDCNAYRLHVGPEAYVSPFRDDLAGESKTRLEMGAGVGIPPGQFAFLLTEEHLEMPHDAMAFISMRSTYKLKGLVNVSGFHVDPGYRGRLIFAVFNASAAHIQVHRGDPCFLIWFSSLDHESRDPYVKNNQGFMDIPSSIINPVGGGKIESLAGLANRIQDLDKRVTQYTTLALLVAGSLFAMTWSQCRASTSSPASPVTVVVPGPATTPPSGTVPTASPNSAVPSSSAPPSNLQTPGRQNQPAPASPSTKNP
ncbi:MAG: hypothetical protein WBD07_03280 [Vicinamibacterales bacterium]